MSEENNIDIKIILLGETGTGKTSLINTYYGENLMKIVNLLMNVKLILKSWK